VTATHHEWSRSTEQVRLRGGDLAELAAVVTHFAAEADESARWFINGDVLVLETPLSETLVGGKPYRIPALPRSAPRADTPDTGQG
jgi:hypothetical protein